MGNRIRRNQYAPFELLSNIIVSHCAHQPSEVHFLMERSDTGFVSNRTLTVRFPCGGREDRLDQDSKLGHKSGQNTFARECSRPLVTGKEALKVPRGPTVMLHERNRS